MKVQCNSFPSRQGSCMAALLGLALAALLTAPAQAQLVSAVPNGQTTFQNVRSVLGDAAGNTYIMETSSGRVTRINPDGTTVTVAGGGTVNLVADPNLGLTEAEGFRLNLAGAEGLSFAQGDFNMLVADTGHHKIIRITREPVPGFESATRLVGRLVAGGFAAGFAGDGGLANVAFLNAPSAAIADGLGNVYIADTGNARVRKVSVVDGLISTIAGNGIEGTTGDGGLAINASIGPPRALALDSAGNLYISTYLFGGFDGRIRKVTPDGIISTVAGTGGNTFSGDSGPAVFASFAGPHGIALDAQNNLYIADSGNHRIRVILPNGKIQTIAGTGDAGDNGLGRQATATSLSNPRAISFTPAGELLISDLGNNRILKIPGVANAPRISVDSFSPSSLNLVSGGLPQRMNITVSRFNFTGNIGFQLSNLPSVVSGGVVSPGLSNAGFVELGAISGVSPGSYSAKLTAYVAGNQGDILSSTAINFPVNIVPAPTLSVAPSSMSFTAIAGGANPASQNITVSDAAFGFIGWQATTSTTSGGNWLTVTPTAGDQTTPLSVGVNLGTLAAGTYSGNVQVASPGANGTPKNVPVTLTVTPPLPLITTGGVQNNASYQRAAASLAPGSIAAIFGTNLTNGSSCLPPSCGPTLVNGRLGTSMVGSTTTINGVAAPYFYATPNQIGVQIPAELGPGSVDVRVTVDGRQSVAQAISIAPTSPGIFTVTSNGTGAGAITHADGNLVTAGNPARPGELLVMYATGLGGTSPAVPTGALPTEAATANNAVLVSIDGRDVTPDYAGLAGCCAGLNQINFRVPEDIRTNTVVTVNINSGGRIANPVTLNIGAPLPPQQP